MTLMTGNAVSSALLLAGLSLAAPAQQNSASSVHNASQQNPHSIVRLERDKATTEILDRAVVVSGNLETSILVLLSSDEHFRRTKQQPEERAELPVPVVYKDGTWEFDWTPGQEARYYMEGLRQEIHQLQGAEKAGGLAAFLPAGREMWQKLRDIVCREYPGAQYFDLDGLENYCPDARRQGATRK